MSVHLLLAPTNTLHYCCLLALLLQVGCTVFKQLFRRMMNYTDWREDNACCLPHNPDRNGLTYLYDVPPAVADQMLTDPSWTRVLFVRDPKERILSAYLDKVVYEQGSYVRKMCCKTALERQQHRSAEMAQKAKRLYKLLHCHIVDQGSHLSVLAGRMVALARRKRPQQQPSSIVNSLFQSSKPRRQTQSLMTGSDASNGKHNNSLITFTDFVTTLYPVCPDPHWAPQANRLADDKYWPNINFVGHFDRLEQDTRRLLGQPGESFHEGINVSKGECHSFAGQ